MKLKEILNEDASDIVARFYKESGDDFDKMYNPENAAYKDDTKSYYDSNFRSWFDAGITPVFDKPATVSRAKYSIQPMQGDVQSPGYRGLQNVLAAAGLPYNHDVQRYESDENRIAVQQSINSVGD